MNIKQVIKRALGYETETDPIVNGDKEFIELYEICKPYSMTSKFKMYSLYKSVEYILKNNIEGDIVECGVWKGGSMMLVAYMLKKAGSKRKIWLYDTYEGMSEPTAYDIRLSDEASAVQIYSDKYSNYEKWSYSPLELVKKNLNSTGYENIVFIKGKVEDTIPKDIPNKIAILRLDTDFYESTAHELKHLYPILSENGVFISDDYGYWKGAKKAVDEYFINKRMLLNRITTSQVMGVKT